MWSDSHSRITAATISEDKLHPPGALTQAGSQVRKLSSFPNFLHSRLENLTSCLQPCRKTERRYNHLLQKSDTNRMNVSEVVLGFWEERNSYDGCHKTIVIVVMTEMVPRDRCHNEGTRAILADRLHWWFPYHVIGARARYFFSVPIQMLMRYVNPCSLVKSPQINSKHALCSFFKQHLI